MVRLALSQSLRIFLATVLLASATWTTLQPVPTPHTAGAMTGTSYNGKVYYNNQDDFHCYNPADDSWTTLATTPTGRKGATANTDSVGGTIFVTGGAGIGKSAEHEMYHVATDTWMSKTSMPTARMGPAGCITGGKVYVVGGNAGPTGPDSVAAMEIYELATDSWATGTAMPTGRAGQNGDYSHDYFLIVGGVCAPADCTKLVEMYTVSTDVWTTKTRIPTSRSTGKDKGRFIGLSFFTQFGSDFHMHLVTTDQWTTLEPGPTAHFQAATALLPNGYYYVIASSTGVLATSAYYTGFASVTSDPVFRTLSGLEYHLDLHPGVFNLLTTPQMAINAVVEHVSTLPPEENLVMTMLGLLTTTTEGLILVDCLAAQGTEIMKCTEVHVANTTTIPLYSKLHETKTFLYFETDELYLNIQMKHVVVLPFTYASIGATIDPTNWLDLSLIPYPPFSLSSTQGLLADLDTRGVEAVQEDISQYQISSGCLFSPGDSTSVFFEASFVTSILCE